LSNRDRSVVGAAHQKKARLALSSLLIDDTNEDLDQMVIMGSNASSLLEQLSRKIVASGIVTDGDEIIIASENHLANVTPWLNVAKVCGATVKRWTLIDTITNTHQHQDPQQAITESCILSDLVTEKTKIVAISHVSNILGMERDLSSICNIVHRVTKNKGQIVVDGVAAAPHLLSPQAFDKEQLCCCPDWYVVSLHKMFGPHLGCLIGKRTSVIDLLCHELNDDNVCCDDAGAASISDDEQLAKPWEMGTMNYEACCGAIALKEYIDMIGIKAYQRYGGRRKYNDAFTVFTNESKKGTPESSNDNPGCGNMNYVSISRMCVQQVETGLLHHLLSYLQSYAPLVRIIQDVGEMKVSHGLDVAMQQPQPQGSVGNESNLQRIPIVCFIHRNIPSSQIVKHCRNHEVVCRACKFLSTDNLWDELNIKDDLGVVRFSLAHYNTLEEIDQSVRVLEMLDGWMGQKDDNKTP